MTVPELKYPQWQEPLVAAILENDPKRLQEKLHSAKELIGKRLDELKADRSAEEFRALYDGLSLIRSFKKPT